MKHLAKLLVTLPFIYCLQLPDLGSLNHLLQTVSADPLYATDVTHQQIVPLNDGTIAVFFKSNVNDGVIQSWLNTNQPDASFCPEN
jgi:hypothetical protein